jgi:hypothetical protein
LCLGVSTIVVSIGIYLLDFCSREAREAIFCIGYGNEFRFSQIVFLFGILDLGFGWTVDYPNRDRENSIPLALVTTIE